MCIRSLAMARAIWKASLLIGRESLPVKLYSAVQDRGVHFRLLHRTDHLPVEQRMVDPESGQEVSTKDVVRGIEIDRGLFVMLSDEELRKFLPKPSRDIEVLRFVPRSAVDPSYYYRPYFLGPDGSQRDYFALAQALGAEERVGIARWVMRNKRYVGALFAHDSHLALVALHQADEVIPADQLERPSGPALKQEERKLAEQLVTTLDSEFDPSKLVDEYRERVLALVQAKARGKKLKMPAEKLPRPVSDLTTALARSVRAAKERGVAA